MLRVRYTGRCRCGATVAAGTYAGWDRTTRSVVCPACLTSSTVAPAPNGVAGASAQAEYERRKEHRERELRAAHPRLAGLILALSTEPQSTRAWQSGAEGERRVAARLAELAGEEVLVLHDRRIPGSRANIDHIAIGPAGVYVIDAKRYANAKVEVRRIGGLFRPVDERLVVAGRDRTRLVTGLAPQVSAVYDALAVQPGAENVPVQPVLCFVDSQLPLFDMLSIAGVPVVGPKAAAKLVRRPGPLGREHRAHLCELLVGALPAMH